MDIVTIITVGAICIGCFWLGAKVGQTVTKGEEIKIPTVNPIEIAREHREKKEVQMQQDKLDKILRNIERYDGTGKGQEDV